MYKYITCPQCGKRLCRAELGSKVEIACSNCKQGYVSTVDENGGVHTLPLDEKVIPKSVAIFHFTLPNNEKVEIDGKIIVSRPEDRIKKRKFRKI